MKLTEKEYLVNNQQLTHRLRGLLLNDVSTFNQIKDYLPFPIYINSRSTKTYHFFSKSFFNKGKEIENLYEIGGTYLDKISNLVLLQKARDKAKQFDIQNNFDSICNYLQIINLNNVPTPFFTNKILVDNELTLNTTLFTSEFQLLDKILKDFLPKDLLNGEKWQLYQTLTKQEVRIVKLLVKGSKNKEIGDFLSISKHTVVTHRKSIYRKLEINNISELIKFTFLLNLI